MLMLEKDTFEEAVLKSQGYVLVDFWSEGCEPCKALMPDVEKLSEEYEGKVTFAKLDTGKARRLAISQKVLGLPTICLYKDGEKIDEVTKEDANASNIKAMIDRNL
ncbi:MAG: thioredoxin domain-containing protein [Sedimentibacter sp.]|jgi:thioredoxin 1|uniref:thioredoxin TrxA n=1 Tax=Sedimentibacter sp. TaxID=1960295 RepID=UPI00315916BF